MALANQARVLVATANDQIAAAAKATLQAAGYVVFDVLDGPAVLLHAASIGADLYILDRDLPQIDGARVARHLRTGYAVSKNCILLLQPHLDLVDYASEVQATDVLPWPFTGVELLLRVTRRLDPIETSKKLPGATES